jgi:hypothetical protein
MEKDKNEDLKNHLDEIIRKNREKNRILYKIIMELNAKRKSTGS